jgi:hypothetical protein
LRRCAGGAWAAAAFGALLVAIDWLGFAQRPSALAQSALLAFAAMLAIAVLGGGRVRALRFTPALVVALAVPIGLLTRSHTLAIWPNALPAFFKVPIAMPAPQLWAFEQHLVGIDALDPWWGFLRGLPLLGCAMLWYALSRLRAQPHAPRP